MASSNIMKDRDLKAVIFDLDGVLCSTDKYHFAAWKMIADELGLPFDEQKNNRLRGVSRMDSLEIILGDRSSEFTDEEKKALADRKNAAYRKLLKNLSGSDIAEGAEEVIGHLRAEGKLIAVGSSSKNTKMILEQLGLLHSFDAISDGTNIMRSKPDPEVFLKAAEYLGIEPPACLVVEDARSGIEAAGRAGMRSAAIGDAAGCGIADHDLESLTDLKEII